MRSILPEDLTTKENYKFLIGSILPRPIAFVSTQSKKGILNLAPFSFFNVVSSDPPRVSLALQRREGVRKDTARNIFETKQFVVHIVDEAILENVNETAASLAYEESELSRTDFTLTASDDVTPPAIAEAKIRMECLLDDQLTFKNAQELVTTDFIIGRVVKFHIDEDLYDDGKIAAESLKPVSRLAGADYSKLGEIKTIERPK